MYHFNRIAKLINFLFILSAISFMLIFIAYSLGRMWLFTLSIETCIIALIIGLVLKALIKDIAEELNNIESRK